jgi:hypothetical protein
MASTASRAEVRADDVVVAAPVADVMRGATGSSHGDADEGDGSSSVDADDEARVKAEEAKRSMRDAS